MKQNVSRLGKGGEDLVANSTLMAQIDEAAEHERKVNEVGGSAYESTYIDTMTVSHLMNVQKADKKQQRSADDYDAKFPVFWVILILGIALAIALYIIYRY